VDILPDPTCPDFQALDGQGRLMYAVLASPLDEDGRLLPGGRRQVGWCYGVTIGPMPTDPSEGDDASL
jgi:hypothetical protein